MKVVPNRRKMKVNLVMVGVLAAIAAASAQQLSFETSVRVPGQYLTPHKICTSKALIFSVTYLGNLYVQNNDGLTYPIVYQTNLSGNPLTGIVCGTKYVYVTGDDGFLRKIQGESPFTIEATTQLTGSPLSDVNFVNGHLLVSQGQGSASAASRTVFLYEFNPGDTTLEISLPKDRVQRTYGATFQSDAMAVYDVDTGDQLGTILSPGQDADASYADSRYFIFLSPGCCGAGIWIYPIKPLLTTFNTPPTPQFISYYNDSVARAGRWLVAGSEASAVAVFDLTKSPPRQVASMSLLPFSGRTEIDAAEARDVQILSYSPGTKSMTIMVGTSWTYPDTPSQYFLKFTW
jgi:hypothetical protein